MSLAYRHRIFLPTMLALVVVAWMALEVWGRSPYHRYLHHQSFDAADVRRGVDLLFIFVAGWTLMTIAMMLPTSLPLISLFQRMTATRPDGAWLVALLLSGYLVVWAGFGLIAHGLDLALHHVADRLELLERNAWGVAAGILLVAGVYQFTPLKYHCLEQCRSPRSFIAGRWRGRDARRESFLLGVQHGAFCVGCCWSLMLLMFLVGMGSVVWMLLLGAVMAVEKNMPWGRRLSAPLGAGLVAAGCVVAVAAIV